MRTNKRAQLDFMIFLITILIIIALFICGENYLSSKAQIGSVQLSIIDSYQIAEQTRDYLQLAAKYSCNNGVINGQLFDQYISAYPTKIYKIRGGKSVEFEIGIPRYNFQGTQAQAEGNITVDGEVEYTNIHYEAFADFEVTCP